MGSALLLLSLLFLLKAPGECSSPEARTVPPQWQPSDVINFASVPNKATTDVTETIKEAYTGSNEGSDSLVPNNQSSEETASKDGSSTAELSVAANSVQEVSTEVTNRSGSATTEEAKLPLIVDLQALQNIRFKRDDESLDSSNSNDSAQDEAGQPEVEDSQSDGFVYSSSREIGNVEEDSEDSTNESPAILEESGDGAEIREERNTNSKEILEGTEQRQGRMIHSWYNQYQLEDSGGSAS